MKRAGEELKADILVVDDTPGNLQLLVTILRSNGYKVRPAINGTFAINAALTLPPDLILLDILMPMMNGYEVCQQLKANPRTKDIPIIFLTALSEELDKVKAFESGAVDYITKPFQIEEVLARIANQLNQRSLLKKLQQQTEILHQQNQTLQAEISNRQLLEKRLLAAEQKMRGVFEAMTDIAIVVQIQAGQIGDIEVLPTNWVRLYSLETDLVTYTIEQLFQPETAASWLSAFEQVLAARQTINFDYTLNIDKNNFCFAAAISPVTEDTVLLVARDISDRKQAEEALRIAQERYHSIVENALEGIYQTTPEGTYLSANPALAKIYGYSSPQELRQSVKDITRQVYVDPKRRQEFIDAMAVNDAVSGFESLVYRQDGSMIWISETARSVKDSTNKLLYYEGIVSNITERRLAQEALEYQKAKTEQLLLSILPPPIAHRLKSGESPISDRYEEVSVLFADLVGFTEFCAQTTPTKLVELLNDIFSLFDRLAEKHGLEKIKTIGDAYMVVGGLPIPRQDSADAIALMALDMQTTLAEFSAKHQQSFQLRIGIHLGPVVAGVIGMSKFIYDLWGDTVNLASRMESSGLPGKIQVTSAIYERLNQQFEFQERGIISVKGKGEMLTYWLMGMGNGEWEMGNEKLQISNGKFI